MNWVTLHSLIAGSYRAVFVFHENHGQGHNDHKHIPGQCGLRWTGLLFLCNWCCLVSSIGHSCVILCRR